MERIEESNAEKPLKPVTEHVIDLMRSRSDVGLKKYGKSMDRDDLSLVEWLTHLQEELLDAAQYVEAAKRQADIPTITREEAREAQTWKGMDGAVAYHLIDRHAENWSDIGMMMGAWREANAPEAVAPEGMMLVQEADLRALAECNFGRFGLPPRAELAARRISDELKAKSTPSKST